jgi:hypothetical protein
MRGNRGRSYGCIAEEEAEEEEEEEEEEIPQLHHPNQQPYIA